MVAMRVNVNRIIDAVRSMLPESSWPDFLRRIDGDELADPQHHQTGALHAADEGYDLLQFVEMDDEDRQIPIIDDADTLFPTVIDNVKSYAEKVPRRHCRRRRLYAVVADKQDIGQCGLGAQGWPHAATDSKTDS